MKDVFPAVDVLLEMQPEELAVYLLEYLCQCEGTGQSINLNRYNFTVWSHINTYSTDNYDAISKAIVESWVWLEREGLIAPQPGDSGGGIFVTRRGHNFRDMGDIRSYKAANFLPKETLDPKLASKVGPAFSRGDYDTAIFEAFKEVEVRVRTLSGLDPTDLGVNLMRKAFHPDAGPLTDTTQVSSERQAISDLFSGAIGCFKNPSSHRDVNFNDPIEVVELIMLADQLIRIAERRKT
ncbi:MAG: TIGR02391 family protein [Syntrophorhabdaceae bacterium]